VGRTLQSSDVWGRTLQSNNVWGEPFNQISDADAISVLQLPYEQASSLNVGEVFVHHQTLYLLWRLKRGGGERKGKRRADGER